ncbi:MAG TPA: hypothetical protein VF516_22865 [Kofleriaceae bacterium]
MREHDHELATHAFRYSGGRMVDLGVPPARLGIATSSSANDINDAGVIVGNSGTL